MSVLLDTSAVIEFLKGNEKAREAMRKADRLHTSSVCAYEVLVGEQYCKLKGLKSNYDHAAALFQRISLLPFSYEDAVKASEIGARLLLKGKKTNDLDILIAVQALSKDAIVLTKDPKHFYVIKEETDLKVESIG